MTDDPEDIDIPYMLLADAAESVGGKLYVLGGGWDRMMVPALPGHAAKPFAMGVGITVPYPHTNRKFALSIELIDGDGNQVGEVLSVELEAGRPPGMLAGTSQSIPLAININPEFPEAGPYTFVASIDGDIRKKASFFIQSMQHMQMMPPGVA